MNITPSNNESSTINTNEIKKQRSSMIAQRGEGVGVSIDTRQLPLPRVYEARSIDTSTC